MPAFSSLLRPAAVGAALLAAAMTAGPAAASARALGRIMVKPEQLRGAHLGQTGQRPIRSLLDITEPMRHGDFVWNDRNVPPGPVWIRVDPDNQLISAFRAGHEIGAAVILYGTGNYPTPRGVFRIIAKLKDHRSSTYDAPMPYTLRFTRDGVAIHGSNVRWGYASHGCVGVPEEFARRLFQQAKIGDTIVVLRPQRRP